MKNLILISLSLLAAGCGNTSTTADMAPAPDFAVPGTGCHSGTRDGMETDVDCGGGGCMPCARGKNCYANADCGTGYCNQGICADSSCSDLLANGHETDVDCGGIDCPKCPLGKACDSSIDCDSGLCTVGTCVMNPCRNGMLDGSETDVDCGGGVCPRCGDNKMCGINTDCESLICNGNHTCQPLPTCMDGIKNAKETDIDCGGTDCPVCADGKVCSQNADCKSGSCVMKICGPTPIKALLVGADSGADLSDVAFRVKNAGGFMVLDTFDARAMTPSLADLKKYDAVMVFASNGTRAADPATLGNNLADYYDNGGQVVLGGGALGLATVVAGRFGTAGNGYLLMDASQSTPVAKAVIGMIAEPMSPLMFGVAKAGCLQANLVNGSLLGGAVAVVQWASGQPLVIRGMVKGRNRADVNLYPVSSQSMAMTGWNGGDEPNLIRNALLYK